MVQPGSSANEDPGVASIATGFESFTRARWAALGDRSEHSLSAFDATQLMATGEPVSLDEVVDVYLPLSQLISLLVTTRREAQHRVGSFLAEHRAAAPFVIAIAGSVAVGKSTTARVLQALLRRSAGKPRVELVPTDGFLHPNAVLESRHLMERKGFPESYDQRTLMRALAALRSGEPEVVVPVYSHLSYDIVPGELQVLRRPEIVILEGLNVLQVNTRGAPPDQLVASDFFDFSIYVDATEEEIARWFRERLLALRATALQDPDSYFHRFALMPEDDVVTMAERIWSEINVVNLRENVAPTRARADLILEKGQDHRVRHVKLRRS